MAYPPTLGAQQDAAELRPLHQTNKHANVLKVIVGWRVVTESIVIRPSYSRQAALRADFSPIWRRSAAARQRSAALQALPESPRA